MCEKPIYYEQYFLRENGGNKMKMRKLLSVLLVLCMVAAGLPMTANAQIVTNSNGSISFTTFEDLKTLAADTYDEEVYCYYNGSGDLVIDENLTLAQNMQISMGDLVVAENVSLTIPDGSCIVYADNLTVSGTIANFGYMFLGTDKENPGNFQIDGKILNYGAIDVYGIEAAKALKNVTHDVSAYLMIIEYMDTVAELKEALATAAATTTPNWEFDINLASENLTIRESLTVPGNAWLTLTGKESFASGHSYTLAEGCALTVDGSLYVVSPLEVKGTLSNNGFICVEHEYGATISVSGTYQGAGDIYVTGVTGDDPFVALSGIDRTSFFSRYTEDLAGGAWLVRLIPQNVSKMENAIYAFYLMEDLVLGDDGIYRTPEGQVVYIAVNNESDGGITYWLQGLTLHYCVETLGDEYFDTSDWAALKALMDENGYVVLTEESLGYLITTTTGNPKWGESEEYIPCYLFYDKPASSGEDDKPEDAEKTFLRIYGATRYDTAFAAADQLKENLGVEKFRNSVVACGTDFADALSGSYLANQKEAPILLVRNRAKEMNAVKDYIKANLAEGGTVYLLGGEKAVPKAMETGLEGFNVKRLAGPTRYETNLAILEEAGGSMGEILVCTGKDYADGLSASAVNKPILLVKDRLSNAQTDYLVSVGCNRYYIIGGTKAVNTHIENALAELSEAIRIEGATRYYTSVNIAKTFFPKTEMAVLAYAQDFPDALSGGPLACSMDAPLILTNGGKQAPAVAYGKEVGLATGAVLGGPKLITDSVAKAVFQMS